MKQKYEYFFILENLNSILAYQDWDLTLQNPALL